VISGIRNPEPAFATSQFSGTIGVDVSVPNGLNFIQLTVGTLAACSATF
jgi:hypothetical protein